MKAFILAAGVGSRLKPLTENKPKALVDVSGKPMLKGLIERLKTQGFNQLLINVYHFGDMIVDFLKYHNNFGIDITISDEHDQLLDTGGAIVKAGWFFEGDSPVLVHNVDIFSDLNFKDLVEKHQNSKALISLIVRERASSRKLLFDNKMQLTGWRNIKTSEYKWVNEKQKQYYEIAYSGIYVASPDYPEQIKDSGSFSIIPQWLEIAKHHLVKAEIHDEGLWFDLGTIDKIKEAEKAITKNKLTNE